MSHDDPQNPTLVVVAPPRNARYARKKALPVEGESRGTTAVPASRTVGPKKAANG